MIHNEQIEMPNLLLIAGNGRNIGKTTIGCSIVSDIAKAQKCIAVKLSPHPHPKTDTMTICFRQNDLLIAQERRTIGTKDSNRYFAAGAEISYYIQCNDTQLKAVSQWLKTTIPTTTPIICEAGGLGMVITPGAAIYIKDNNGKKEGHKWQFPFTQIASNNGVATKPTVEFNHTSWHIK